MAYGALRTHPATCPARSETAIAALEAIAAPVAPEPGLATGEWLCRWLASRVSLHAVAGRMSGEPLGAEARPFVEAMAAEEDRVVVRCRPYATFAQPPRHLHRNDQVGKLTHWSSATVPWGAPDPA